MKRADRRQRTDLVIKRRLQMHRQSMTGSNPAPHSLHKHDTMGRCSNRGCWLCAYERYAKKDEKRSERREGKAVSDD